jgi:hypothetical protein
MSQVREQESLASRAIAFVPNWFRAGIVWASVFVAKQSQVAYAARLSVRVDGDCDPLPARPAHNISSRLVASQMRPQETRVIR